MAQSVKRARQVADVIRHELAYSLKKEVQDPRLRALSLTLVDVSPDLRHAKVYFVSSQEGDIALIKQALAKAKGFLRCVLAQKINMRYIPQIEFIYDAALERGARVTELIDQALSDEEKSC